MTEAEAVGADVEQPPAPDPTNVPVPEPEPTTAPERVADAEQPETPSPEAEPPVHVETTTITGDSILDDHTYYDAVPDELMDDAFRLPLPADGYQILIIHTHATEAYMPTEEEPYDQDEDCRTTDPEHSVIRVGEELAQALSAYGLNVLHDTQLHDYPSYNGSYARSGETVEAFLADHPEIGIVIDLHRDALEDGDTVYRTDAGIDSVEAAQLMFVMGSDVNLEHPGWRENLKLALTLQKTVSERWPTLMRPVVLCDYRYNQQLTPGSLLLEVGTSGNTLEEALAAVDLFAEAVGPLLASWTE